MANNWFQFKQFKVVQGNVGMKVSTDACIFGAWLNTIFENQKLRVLDIGTGTGLLSLMWLQANPDSLMSALEPNKAAAQDALQNFRNAAWSEKISLYPNTLQDFATVDSDEEFELLICNPPFFQGHLKGSDVDRNLARHDGLLPEELARCALNLVQEKGHLAVIYPENIWLLWMKAAQTFGWQLQRQLNIKPTSEKAVNRVCGLFSRQSHESSIVIEELLIRQGSEYTTEFKCLMQPYYLFL